MDDVRAAAAGRHDGPVKDQLAVRLVVAAAGGVAHHVGGDEDHAVRTAGVAVELPSVGNQLEIQLEGKDRKSTRLNSSHLVISYAVFCLEKERPLTRELT